MNPSRLKDTSLKGKCCRINRAAATLSVKGFACFVTSPPLLGIRRPLGRDLPPSIGV
jgi:hypothetical protein